MAEDFIKKNEGIIDLISSKFAEDGNANSDLADTLKKLSVKLSDVGRTVTWLKGEIKTIEANEDADESMLGKLVQLTAHQQDLDAAMTAASRVQLKWETLQDVADSASSIGDFAEAASNALTALADTTQAGSDLSTWASTVPVLGGILEGAVSTVSAGASMAAGVASGVAGVAETVAGYAESAAGLAGVGAVISEFAAIGTEEKDEEDIRMMDNALQGDLANHHNYVLESTVTPKKDKDVIIQLLKRANLELLPDRYAIRSVTRSHISDEIYVVMEQILVFGDEVTMDSLRNHNGRDPLYSRNWVRGYCRYGEVNFINSRELTGQFVSLQSWYNGNPTFTSDPELQEFIEVSKSIKNHPKHHLQYWMGAICKLLSALDVAYPVVTTSFEQLASMTYHRMQVTLDPYVCGGILYARMSELALKTFAQKVCSVTVPENVPHGVSSLGRPVEGRGQPHIQTIIKRSQLGNRTLHAAKNVAMLKERKGDSKDAFFIKDKGYVDKSTRVDADYYVRAPAGLVLKGERAPISIRGADGHSSHLRLSGTSGVLYLPITRDQNVVNGAGYSDPSWSKLSVQVNGLTKATTQSQLHYGLGKGLLLLTWVSDPSIAVHNVSLLWNGRSIKRWSRNVSDVNSATFTRSGGVVTVTFTGSNTNDVGASYMPDMSFRQGSDSSTYTSELIKGVITSAKGVYTTTLTGSTTFFLQSEGDIMLIPPTTVTI